MSDLLSAVSLLLAIEAVLFGLWYPEIVSALNLKPKTMPEDRKAQIREVDRTLWSRAVPLAASSLLLAAIFMPDVWAILRASTSNLKQNGLWSLSDYTSIQASFCFVVTFALVLGIYAAGLAIRLRTLRKKMSH